MGGRTPLEAGACPRSPKSGGGYDDFSRNCIRCKTRPRLCVQYNFDQRESTEKITPDFGNLGQAPSSFQNKWLSPMSSIDLQRSCWNDDGLVCASTTVSERKYQKSPSDFGDLGLAAFSKQVRPPMTSFDPRASCWNDNASSFQHDACKVETRRRRAHLFERRSLSKIFKVRDDCVRCFLSKLY